MLIFTLASLVVALAMIVFSKLCTAVCYCNPAFCLPAVLYNNNSTSTQWQVDVSLRCLAAGASSLGAVLATRCLHIRS